MDHGTGHIVEIVSLDKRMTGGNSVAMEKEGLRKALLKVKDKGLQVSEVVTDAHIGIAAMMSKS